VARYTHLDQPGDSVRRRGPFRFWVTIGWLVVIGAAFGGGYTVARYDAGMALTRIQVLQNEVASLSEDLAATKAAHVRLERAHLMDREAKRVAQEQLAELQGERLRLAKRVAYFQRLLSADGAGVVEVKEAVISPGEKPGSYHYRLTLSQLIPEIGRSAGTVTLKVAMEQDGKRVVRSLDDLPGSSPARQRMDFEHFQTFDGDIVLPADAEPQHLIVDVNPSTSRLVQSSDAFIWPSADGRDMPLIPDIPSTGRAASAVVE